MNASPQRSLLEANTQLVSNTMVSCPEEAWRQRGLVAFRGLLQLVSIHQRFDLIHGLTLQCPYGNVAAILIDQLRLDATAARSAPDTTLPHKTVALGAAVARLLKHAVERDLPSHADLISSVLSLCRFALICDKVATACSY
ncbi:hypothetical protein PINS_up002499 [Pythium insidiosum]|nr:hypothetical protein PINS_up002499 [Pythium insidiosum]